MQVTPKAPATFGMAVSAGLGAVTSSLMMVGNFAEAGERMSEVVLQKATHFAEINKLNDDMTYATAKAAVDARLVELKASGLTIDLK